ncbi:MAG TPA: molybdopterin-dependent oxidoreductase [Solirubrobacteraceae bacterium]|nr:molybdopterin-dependent oxidoreductase [Solirubrobacteraceae bacterium]
MSVPTETRSLCPYCGVGCGLLVYTEDGRMRGVKGDPLYPVNRGRTCRKPLELAPAVHADDRALTPLMRGGRDARFEEASWDQALGSLAARLQRIAAEHGPDALGFYISGQLLTEDYYVIGKLVKGFLGTNNLDSNSRLCMSSAVAGYTGAFGSDGPPGAYSDIELSECLLLLGSNTAACHPILWSRIRDRQREGAFVICVDPRPTPTARAADLHLPVRPGSDLALLASMLGVIEAEGMLDRAFIAAHTTGFEAAVAVARQWPPERAAEACGIEAELIVEAARRFGAAPTAMAMWSMGANQSTVGTLKNRALINLCLATGNLGRPGCGPFSLTGQPNAMGGRESGGLAQLLPGYRQAGDPADRRAMAEHWGIPASAPGISERPGLSAVDLFQAAAEGTVKALWIVATNPVVSMPDSDLVRAALERAELVVVQDAHHPTETSALAHVVLPAAAWPEKEGAMTNSERRVGLVRRALEPPGEARPDWRIFAGLAGALGYGEHFEWDDEAAVFAEFVRCTEGRLCDMSGLSHERLRRSGGIQWPGGRSRLYPDRRVATPDGRARFEPTPHVPPAESTDAEFPLLLTTGRIADQWHTMTRTGKSSALRRAIPEPLLELHPDDAAAAGVRDTEMALVTSRRGELRLRVQVVPGLARGVAFAPFHWGPLQSAPGAGALNATTHGATDPLSRQPELKALAIRVEPAPAATPVRRPAPGRRRLVVVGTGMAGLAVVEEAVLRRRPSELRVTMLGEEAAAPYNRILVSKLLARTCGLGDLELRPDSWFPAHGVALRSGCAATGLDLDARQVLDESGERHDFDSLVLATGSRPFLPPIPGVDAPHVRVFRTPGDVDGLATACRRGCAHAVVVGGGLLGLEAAAGLLARGVQVTVVEVGDRLMPQQLDRGAGSMLERTVTALGLRTRLGRAVAKIAADHVRLDDGEEIEASLVVVAAGVRPETTLARGAGIECRRGIVVDDEMRTSAPGVWAVGECAEHRGTVYGLWAPLADQARVAGAGVVGDPGAFHGATPATTLKVAGVDLFAGGSTVTDESHDEILFADTRRRRYRRLILDGPRLASATLVGDVGEAKTLSGLLRSGAPVPASLLEPMGAADQAADEGPEAIVCSCNTVTRGRLIDAIRGGGVSTVTGLGRATRAGTGCGGCTGDLETLLARAAAGELPEGVPA